MARKAEPSRLIEGAQGRAVQVDREQIDQPLAPHLHVGAPHAEGDDGDGGRSGIGDGRIGDTWRAGRRGLAPEHDDEGARHHHEQCEQQKLEAAGALLSFLAVVPGDDEHGEEADASDEDGAANDRLRPAERVGDEAQRLEEQPGAGQIDDRPLGDLALSDAA
jgi:hypothetical protein